MAHLPAARPQHGAEHAIARSRAAGAARTLRGAGRRAFRRRQRRRQGSARAMRVIARAASRVVPRRPSDPSHTGASDETTESAPPGRPGGAPDRDHGRAQRLSPHQSEARGDRPHHDRAAGSGGPARGDSAGRRLFQAGQHPRGRPDGVAAAGERRVGGQASGRCRLPDNGHPGEPDPGPAGELRFQAGGVQGQRPGVVRRVVLRERRRETEFAPALCASCRMGPQRAESAAAVSVRAFRERESCVR
jgi:hypothetical protein